MSYGLRLFEDKQSKAQELLEEEKRQVVASNLKTCLLFPAAAVVAGTVANMAGADLQAAAVAGAVVSGAVPLVGTFVGTAITAALGAENGRKLARKVATVGLAGTIVATVAGASMGVASHVVTDLARDNLPKVEMIVKDKWQKLPKIVDLFEK